MPPGCVLQSALGHLQCWNGVGVAVDCSNTNDETSANYGGSRGFSIAPWIQSNRSLATQVSYWHDGLNGVSVRVKYKVLQSAGVACDVPGFTQP